MNDAFTIESLDDSFTIEQCERLRAIAGELLRSSRATELDEDLARAVHAVSEAYTTRRDDLGSLASGRQALAARVAFYLPRDAPKIGWPLSELASRGLLAREKVRLLDLGAGVGATALGTGRFLRASGLARRLEVLAIDRDPAALSQMRRVVDGALELGSVPIDLETRALDFSKGLATVDRDFDLIVFGLSLNELGDPAAARDAVERAARHCARTGAVISIEPALRETTRALMELRDAIASESSTLHVFAPCVRSGPCPMLASARDWCHAEMPVRLAPPLAALARAAGLRTERLTFSYLTLRLEPSALARAADRTLGRIVSEPLISKGKRELVACGEGGLVRLRRLDRRRSDTNAVFDQLVRGDVVAWDGTPEVVSDTEIARQDTRVSR